MLWLERWRWHRAAKAYGARLPAYLAHAYGAAPYTPDQVDTAVRALGLDPTYAALGYAAFVSKADYARKQASLPKPIERELARVIYDRYRPWARTPDDEDWGDPLNTGGIGASRGPY